MGEIHLENDVDDSGFVAGRSEWCWREAVFKDEKQGGPGVCCGKKVDFFDDGAVFDQELSVFLRTSAAVKVPTWSEGVDVRRSLSTVSYDGYID